MKLSQIFSVARKRLFYAMKLSVATIDFPFVAQALPQGSRVNLRNKILECIGCFKCQKICPVKCIDIEADQYSVKENHPKTPLGHIIEQKVNSFTVDFSRCIQCGLCVDICPTQSMGYEKQVLEPKSQISLLKTEMVRRPRSQERGLP